MGLALAVACADPSDRRPADDPSTAALARLRTFETARRSAADFRTLPTADEALGPDPVAVATLPPGDRVVGVLRGRDAVVLLDADGRERARTAAPAAPSSIAVAREGEVLVASELSSAIARYAVRDDRLERTGSIPLPGVRGIRAIAAGPEDVLYAVEEHDHRLLTVSLREGAIVDAVPIGLGPRTVLRTPRHLVVTCALAHTVVLLEVDERGIPRRDGVVRITHDAPILAADAHEVNGGVVLALGGVEDHPLDRRQGSFGYIDSFAWVYRVAGTPPVAERLAAVNASALGVVMPKVVALTLDGDDVRVHLTASGEGTAADLRWASPRPTRKGTWPAPDVATRPFVPGTTMAASLGDGRRVLADPLLDAWVVDDGTLARVVPVPDAEPARSTEARVGEALFFTTLIAPWNRTKGSVSRFTCETCHLEGYVDGRIHDTGRGDVHVTTRPLLGLLSLRPYFSRALDPDLTAMVHNEFRVAGRRSRHDPWFARSVADTPWLAYLGVGPEPLEPETLRRALIAFLMEFTHRPNPSAFDRSAWSDEERRGATIFRDRCEGCHEARLVADRADTRVPFDAWEPLTFSPQGPIVWARDGYEKTGVVPYVHENGTRVAPLRRLYKKRPYLTNGAAADLDDLLRRARSSPAGFLHEGDGTMNGRLDDDERRALEAFLDLL